MTETDTTEKGHESLIIAAMTGPTPPPSNTGDVLHDGGIPYGGTGWLLIDVLLHGIKHGAHNPWTDSDHVSKLITDEIPARVAADTGCQNAKKNSDKQNARIEHGKSLLRVMTAPLADDTELFKQFSDNDSFRRWLTDAVSAQTYA